MTKDKIRYLVPRANKDGSVSYNWQPKSRYRDYGWRTVPLGKDEAIAKQKALQLNAELDAWRAGGGEAPRDPADVGANPPDGDKVRPGTLGLLIRHVETSDKFKRLTDHTQRDYKWLHGILDDWAGTEHVRHITPPRVQALYQAFRAETPRKAQLLVTRLHTVLEHGRRTWNNWPHPVNPASDQDMQGGSATEKLLWLPDMVTAFVAKADAMGFPSIGTAILLNEWCGQRMGDLVAMPADILQDDGTVQIRQSKTGARVKLPVGLVPHLADRLKVAAAHNRTLAAAFGVQPTTILVCENTGRAWKTDFFRKKFSDIRTALAEDIPTFPHPIDPSREARTLDLWFMHTRHTAVVRMAEAEVDSAGISAVTGHKLTSVDTILEHYLIRTVKMAENAFRKRLNAEGKS